MGLSPAKFKEKVANAKRNADIKQVIESTGARPVSSNAAKGEYTYHAPYREDVDPSLKINVHLQKFIDYGLDGSEGDVIELVRRIFGKGDINAMPFFKAVEWLERFSGGSVAPKAIQPTQRLEKQPVQVSHEGNRFTFVQATPVSAKTHPNNLDYILNTRKISLAVASRHLHVITYQDHAAALDDPLRGQRYAIGGPNDAGGWEARAPSVNSNFKLSLGPKDITTYSGKPDATTGHIFEGRFDFLTFLEIAGVKQPDHPTVILNTGRFAARAAEVIKKREEWQHVKNWHIWQHNDDEGRRTTGVICDELIRENDAYTIGTLEHLYAEYNDLNECWMKAPESEHTALVAQIKHVQPAQKFYDSSSTAELHRAQDQQRGNVFKPKL